MLVKSTEVKEVREIFGVPEKEISLSEIDQKIAKTQKHINNLEKRNAGHSQIAVHTSRLQALTGMREGMVPKKEIDSESALLSRISWFLKMFGNFK